MNYKSEYMQKFKVIGFSTEIRPEEGYIKCPKFWEEEYNQKYMHLWKTMKPETEEEQAICDNKIGMLALCIDKNGSFEYMIAGMYKGGKVPDSMKLYELPESEWIVFSTKGPLPSSLQQLNTYVWKTWYPTEGQAFEPNGMATIEYYSAGNPKADDYECGIWIPVKRK